MAESAEQLVAGTGWLPRVLRTVEPSLRAADPEVAIEDRPAFAMAAEAAGRGAMASRLFFVGWEFWPHARGMRPARCTYPHYW